MGSIAWELVLFRQSLELICEDCTSAYRAEEPRLRCDCGGLLQLTVPPRPESPLSVLANSKSAWERSGVWRYAAWHVDLQPRFRVFRGEGNTPLIKAPSDLLGYAGCKELLLKHEGENPTGSFKDRGMVMALSVARAQGYRAVACASTGNTSASMAAYAAMAGLKSIVFLPAGKIAMGKLSQSLAYGATTVQMDGNFDQALKMAEALCPKLGIALLNSINPFRLAGQKSIGFELMEDLQFESPDWIVVPGGNLGNVSAIGQAVLQLRHWNVIDRLPRICVVQAAGASPFARYFQNGFSTYSSELNPETIATAIRIGNPVSVSRAKAVIEALNGMVLAVSDDEILRAKAVLDRAGIGAEPASCATVAGLHRLRISEASLSDSRCVAVLTGNLLKDPEICIKESSRQGALAYNPGVMVSASEDEVARLLNNLLA